MWFIYFLFQIKPAEISSVKIIRSGKSENFPTLRTLTEDGFCETLNLQPFHEIFNQNITHLNYSTKKTTLKFDGDGINHRFELKLIQNKSHIEPLCGGLEQGYFVYIHAPDEYPDGSDTYYHAPLDSKFVIQLIPTIYNDDEESQKSMPLIERQCYVPEEKILHYFKSYNRNNCKLECLMNATLEKCQCARFFMPYDNVTRVCGTEHKECYQKVSDSISEDLIKCECFPMCKTIEYEADTQYFLYDLKTMNENYDAIDTYTGDKKNDHLNFHINTIQIFFKNSNYMPLKRIELTGWSDFLANCGGLMGLFAGVSIMTIVEILYFCLCRYGGEAVIGPRIKRRNCELN